MSQHQTNGNGATYSDQNKASKDKKLTLNEAIAICVSEAHRTYIDRCVCCIAKARFHDQCDDADAEKARVFLSKQDPKLVSATVCLANDVLDDEMKLKPMEAVA